MPDRVGSPPSAARRGTRRRPSARADVLGLLAGLIGLTAATAATAAAPTSTTPMLDLQPCELKGSGGQRRVAARCGYLTVAENPDDPDGARIDLFVARIPALSPEPAADAFTLVNGGPGGSSVSLYVDLEAAFSGIRRNRDIVIMDQRGTGRSAPLDCPELEDTAQDFNPELIRRATRACLDALERDPRFYNTSIAVADLEQLRQTLGYDRWNLYGVSYGTRVAQHYLQRFPGAVRTLILDGVVPPGLALGPDIAGNAQKTLDELLARCAGAAYCAEAFSDLTGQFDALGTRLRASPVTLELAHPVTGRQQSFTLRYGHLAMTVRMLSYAPETASLIPLIIAEAASRENYLPIASQALRIERELGSAISFGMHNSVVCSEDAPFYGDLTHALPDLAASYLGADQVRALQTICADWPAGPVHPALRTEIESDLPVLLLSGEHDPITPPAYAETAARGLSNSRHLVAPGQGHGVLPRGCIPFLVEDFVNAGSPASIDGECLDRMAADAFFVNLMGPPP